MLISVLEYKQYFETNPLYHKLISNFKKNRVSNFSCTSFNVRGEPIVCNPADAFNCFMGTELDLLIIGNFILKEIAGKNIINEL